MALAVMSASALGLVGASFLDWFSAGLGDDVVTPEAVGVNGWGLGQWYVWVLPPVLIGLLVLVVVPVRVFLPRARLAQFGWDRMFVAAGLVTALFTVVKLANGEDSIRDDVIDGDIVAVSYRSGDAVLAHRSIVELDIAVTGSVGIYLALAGALGLAVGAYLHIRAEPPGPLRPVAAAPANSGDDTTNPIDPTA